MSNLPRNPSRSDQTPYHEPDSIHLTDDLDQTEHAIRDIFEDCTDVIFRHLELEGPSRLLFVYLQGFTDPHILNLDIIKPLSERNRDEPFTADILKTLVSSISEPITDINLVAGEIACGAIVCFSQGEAAAYSIEISQPPKRNIEEPSNEVVVRGPREGFIEDLNTNITMLRRALPNPTLKTEAFRVGKTAKRKIVIAYLKNIAPVDIVNEVRERIQNITADQVSNYMEEFIEDSAFTLFPQIQNTERPDIVSSSLLEGKVAILIDGNPFVLILPMTLLSGLQAADDYYERFIYTSAIRAVRLILFLISIYLPSLYISITSYHPQMLPTNLLLSILSAREGIPLPVVFEVLIMEFMFEGLREAGLRLPKQIGSAVSIVGALVIGQAAVQAGIVSAPMVIVVAATGISSFAAPRYNVGTAARMLRFPMLILAALFGLFGIIMGSILLIVHLTNLSSYGTPYLSPLVDREGQSLRDTFIRAPRWMMHRRPRPAVRKSPPLSGKSRSNPREERNS
ncbi:spore germination protein [Paenibacillus agri]|uniref:Spore germination protein n=1 Tax=Paenibacillus agri TaxID=2744309 RepID=A0A850ELT0_9BACL|nr:spore germination protein [Paenibacillus agri]NUU60467.1 spore germination protein [Paenibacillus agri]